MNCMLLFIAAEPGFCFTILARDAEGVGWIHVDPGGISSLSTGALEQSLGWMATVCAKFQYCSDPT